jgi:hypothetical protein
MHGEGLRATCTLLESQYLPRFVKRARSNIGFGRVLEGGCEGHQRPTHYPLSYEGNSFYKQQIVLSRIYLFDAERTAFLTDALAGLLFERPCLVTS